MMLICHQAIKENNVEIKDAYKQKMAAQLKEWGAQIDLLEAKAENAGGRHQGQACQGDS
jgi:hypothetical protein